MGTSKRKRKYAQDFSGDSRTDQSFAPACDVNYIVKHYQKTGIEPEPDRLAIYKQQAQSEETLVAPTLTYADAMRNKAAFDSWEAENPDWRQRAAEAAEAAFATDPSLPPGKQGADAPVASGDAKTAPQDASDGES